MNIEVEKENVRLDSYLAEVLDISRSKIQKLISDGRITIEGKKISPSYKTIIGEEVIIADDLNFEMDITKENIPIDIIYQDDDLLVINKESGMVVHPAPGNYSGTLVNALLYQFSLSHEDSLRPGIVHRLDKDTSGLMLVAKNDWTHEKLANMIKERQISRHYLALVDGIIPHETGTIDAPIGRDPDNRQKMKVTDENSKNAITNFKVLERFPKYNQTLIECKLETGRTHQIRVHLAYIGYPVYNDPIYGKKRTNSKFGQFLHSKSIRFNHPRTNKELYFEVEPPLEFLEYLKNLREEIV